MQTPTEIAWMNKFVNTFFHMQTPTEIAWMN